MKVALSIFLVLLCWPTLGCDSSSDSDISDVGAVSIRITPDRLRVETLAFVELAISSIQFDDLDTGGLTIKFIVSNDLSYRQGSGVVVYDDGAISIEPVYEGPVPAEAVDTFSEAPSSANLTYLIFTVSGEDVSEEDTLLLHFDLEAVGAGPQAAVLLDVDRAAVNLFDPVAPNFDTELEVEVEIISESTLPETDSNSGSNTGSSPELADEVEDTLEDVEDESEDVADNIEEEINEVDEEVVDALDVFRASPL